MGKTRLAPLSCLEGISEKKACKRPGWLNNSLGKAGVAQEGVGSPSLNAFLGERLQKTGWQEKRLGKVLVEWARVVSHSGVETISGRWLSKDQVAKDRVG